VTESLPPEDPRDGLIREQAARLAAQDEQIAALTALVAVRREAGVGGSGSSTEREG